jgi:uncharacterized protein involved in exopolysaccharide biosynthesis
MDNGKTNSDQYELANGLIYIMRVFLANIRKIAIIVFGVMVIMTIVVLLIPNKYTSEASILPTGKQDNLSALKMLAGFSGAGLDTDENSSILFPEVLVSNQVRDAIIAHRYAVDFGDGLEKITLKEYFVLEKPEYLRGALGNITDVEVDDETGIIYISITTENAEFSQAILRQTLAELENYNLNIRRSKAKESELYLKRELNDQAETLAKSEKALEEFQKVNRDWYGSNDPEILMTLGRLKRDIEINSQTYLLLREQYEMARLTAQKDVPIVRILDQPSLPTLKSSPRRSSIIILSGMIVFILYFGFIIVSDAFKRVSDQSVQESFGALSNDFAKAFPKVNRLLLKRKNKTRAETAIPEQAGD